MSTITRMWPSCALRLTANAKSDVVVSSHRDPMKLEVITRSALAPQKPLTLLFIHGAFHGAWCWAEYFMPWFAERGWASLAFSLRGHGLSEGSLSIRHWKMQDYEDDLREVMANIRTPVVLIGHSMGGVLAQMCWASASNVSAMALLASSPRRRSLGVIARLSLKQPVAVFWGLVGGDPDRAKPAYLEFFFSPQIGREKRKRYERQLSSESPKALREVFSREEMRPDQSDRRPVLVVAGKDDWSIPMKEHRHLAKTYRASLITCPGAHDLMLDESWSATAEAINSWLNDVVVTEC